MFNWLSTLAATLYSVVSARLVPALIFTAMGLLVIQAVRKAVAITLNKTKLEKAAHSLIISLVSTIMYVLLGLIVASRLGIDVTSIIALASVLTLAVSLALQNILANVIGGFTILYTHPFHSGDYVEVAGQAGTVQEINMTYTQLTTPDNRLVSIPNSAVVASQIVNYTATGSRRLDVNVSVAYDTDPQTVIDALVICGTLDKVLLEPAPFAAITGYAEGVIQYSLRLWVKSGDYWDVYFTVNQNIRKIFQEQGIRMRFQQLAVQLDK